ncbi:acyltransferase family-domain-containing protein [Dichotomopilus funicola]|uniref:Acyltransferase family-domain-containing protein n=1 Tax=Dichotomopilus funicola TaxID=1934379 RepID=A0AAN6V3L0_9PEZI|nr:acyltransferase family-domain-containing protein [Dichotomopilus funicola]
MTNDASYNHGLAYEGEKTPFLSGNEPFFDDLEHAAHSPPSPGIRLPAYLSQYRPRQWRTSKTISIPTMPTTSTIGPGARRALSNLPFLLRRTFVFLLPSFIQPLVSPTPSSGSQPSARPGPTAYLDGMRGLAALIVFFCHFLYTSFVIAPGYGTAQSHYHLPLLPFIRLLFSGPPMVCLFFVVSGYALSLKPIRLIYSRSHSRSPPSHSSATKKDPDADLLRTLTSFTIRRPLRLFLPPFLSTLLVILLVHFGLYDATRPIATNPVLFRNVREPHFGWDDSIRSSTLWQLIRGPWAKDMFRFVHVWDWTTPFGGSTGLDVHLWTIPVEFRCSMVVFLTVVGTARLRGGWRGLVLGGLAGFGYVSGRWEMVLFWAGMGLAELDVVRGAHGTSGGSLGSGGEKGGMVNSSSRTSSPSPTTPLKHRHRHHHTLLHRAFITTLSITALYLLSQPDENGAETPGWVYLTSLIPQWWTDEHRYWQSAGAILFVYAVGRSRGWQRFFTLPAMQYLGRISYALYLMHGPVMHTAGYAIHRWAWGVTGTEGAYEAGFALAAVVIVPVVIWAADVFWRVVDAPVVRLAKWVEVKCSVAE